MGGEADSGKAKETRQEGRRTSVGSGWAEVRRGTHMEKERKSRESVLNDKQEILRQGFLRQNVTVKKGKLFKIKTCKFKTEKTVRSYDPSLEIIFKEKRK